MNMQLSRWIAVTALSFALAACGGGDLSTGTDSGSGGGDDLDVTPTTLSLSADSNTLLSSASTSTNGVQLKVIVTDENNNIIPGVTVIFSTSAAPNNGTLIVTNPAVTNSSGEVTATLTTGGNPQNRTITVFATTSASEGNLSVSTPIDVIGTTLAISGATNTQIGQATTYTVTLKDAANRPISNRTVVPTATAGNVISSIVPSNGKTSSTGQLTFVLTPGATAPPLSTITVTALGLTQIKDINVSTDQFTISTDSLVNADGEIEIGAVPTISVNWKRSGVAVSGEPVTFSATQGTFNGAVKTLDTVNTDPSGNASATLQSSEAGFSTVQASGDGVTAGVDVEFVAPIDSANSIFLGASPAVIATSQSSALTATVRDMNNNPVKNVLVAFSKSDITGGRLSPASAVTDSFGQANATYSASTQSSATDGVVVTATTTNTATELTDQIALTVGSRPVGISIGTGSGIKIIDSSTYGFPFTVVVTDAAGKPADSPSFTISTVPISYVKGVDGSTILECDSEDVNFNNILEPGEDLNGNTHLDPGVIAAVAPVDDYDPATGTQQFQLIYAKQYGRFVTMRVTGVVSATGSESTTSRDIVLTIAEADVDNLSSTSPFGTVVTATDGDADGNPDGCQAPN